MSTEAPKLENEALASVFALMAPTVMALGAEAGDMFVASFYTTISLMPMLTQCQSRLTDFGDPSPLLFSLPFLRCVSPILVKIKRERETYIIVPSCSNADDSCFNHTLQSMVHGL